MLIFHVFGALADYDLDLIRERTNSRLAVARARGRTEGVTEEAGRSEDPGGGTDALRGRTDGYRDNLQDARDLAGDAVSSTKPILK